VKNLEPVTMLAAVYAAYYLGRDPYYLSLFYYILLALLCFLDLL
jgi:hypothetical protein